MIIWIILGLILLLIFWAILKFNALIRLKNLINEAWSGIDIQLKRRYDLIPNLVQTVKGYATHEKGVFENIAKYRSASMHATTLDEKIEAETQLTRTLKTLFAVAENYPELKANQNFLELQKELSNIENNLQLARRYYNGVAREYNTAIQVFPNNIVASVFRFERAPYFEIGTAERETPKVNF